jgi:hypothetical protein
MLQKRAYVLDTFQCIKELTRARVSPRASRGTS